MHEEGQVEGGRREVSREEQRVDGLAHLGDVGVARGGVGGEGPLEYVGERLRHRVVVPRRAREPGRPHELRGVDPGRGWLAGQGLEEDGAQAEDVGARVSEAAPRLLGCEVAPLGLEQELPLSNPARPVAEALEPDLALVGDDDAGGGQEAVKRPGSHVVLASVGVLEGSRDLARDEEGVVDGKGIALLPAALQDLLQALPLDELVGDVVGRVDLADAEDPAGCSGSGAGPRPSPGP